MMKQAIQFYHLLSESVQKNCKDASLLTQLEKSLLALEPEAIDPQVYSRLMFSIYDLSNHYTLIQQQPSHPNPINKDTKIIVHNLGIRLKLVSMRMICILMQLIMKGNSNVPRLDREIQVEALEIMILSIRLCLDSQVDCLEEVLEDQKFCNQLYSYYCPIDFGQQNELNNVRNSPISEDIEILYYLNKLDLLRLTLDSSLFQMSQLQISLKMSSKLILFGPTISKQCKQKYSQYISNIVTEITLKLLRQGYTDCLDKLKYYLPDGMKTTISKLMNGDFPPNSEVNIGEVYELYWHICTNGMQSVSLDSLQKFIAKDKVFQGEEIFEAILLINQPILLEIWFNEANKRMSKPRNIIQAYECFIYLIASFINKDKIKESLQNSNKQERKYQDNEATKTNDLVRLCKQVMLNLFRENKDSQVPISIVANYIAKYLLELVMNMFSYEICREMFENLYLVCNKHSLHDIHKTISALNLYYDLLNHMQNEETFKKFTKLNANDKSQTLKLLKTCYEMQKGNIQIDQNSINIVKRKPEFALLFCEPKDRAMLILNMDIKYLTSMPNIFEVYATLLEENVWDDTNLQKIATHLQNFLLSTQFSKLLITQSSCHKLKTALGKLIQKQNPAYSMLFLYLCCFVLDFEKIKSEQYGIVFNKYSKILKILDLVALDSQIICILKILICKSCQKFKKILNRTNKCIPEAGQIMFIKLIYKTIEKWIHNCLMDQQSHKNSQQFIKFSIFQIFCINNRQQELQELIDQEEDIKIQQLFISSQYIPKKYKLVLLRKLFKSGISTGNTLVTLNDMKQLILLAETPQESYIYITSTLQIFGEKGRKFINLLAEQNSKVAQLCLQVFNSENQ